MLRLCSSLVLLVAAARGTMSLPLPDDQPLDCAVRSAAYARAVTLLGAPQPSFFEALAMAAYCGAPPLAPPPLRAPSTAASRLAASAAASAARGAAAPTFFADAASGDDGNSGTAAQPFRSLPRGVAACRAAAAASCAILLTDAAPFVLTAPLALGAADSGLTLGAVPGDAPIVTGAAPVASAWTPLRVTSGDNVWRAALPAGAPLPRALLAGGRRLPRARWPNAGADWETDRVPTGYTNASSWMPPRVYPPATQVYVPAAARPYDHYFPNFTWARGGVADDFFDPPEGYWIAPHPAAGSTFAVPAGFHFTPSQWSPRAGEWNVSAGGGAVVKAFHGQYWGSWSFSLASINMTAGTAVLGSGGWQEARGWPSGGALFVENVREELDAPGEWFADEGTIDIFWNSSGGTPPPPGAVSLAALESLITISGTPDAPAADISIEGLTLTGTQPTFLSAKFVAPSGGDWSFSPIAAVSLGGAARVRVSRCAFTALGGNAVLLRGWNRGVVIENSTFDRIGESAIVTVGIAALADLSGLTVPVDTRITGCLFSNVGVDVKQAGGVYSALSANHTISGNVFHSMPRAAININDGAHGGHLISRNVFARTVLETADHGAINTWGRQPYIQTYNASARDPLVSVLTQNLLLNQDSYAIHPLDHDDGSANYADTNNVLAFAGLKNWQGFSRTWLRNLIIRPDYLASPPRVPGVSPDGVPLPTFYYFPACVRSLGQFAWGPLADVYANNTCILNAPSAYIFGSCEPASPSATGDVPRASNNTFLVKGGAVEIACGGKVLTLAAAQTVGYDVGSVQEDTADLSPADVIGMLDRVLGAW